MLWAKVNGWSEIAPARRYRRVGEIGEVAAEKSLAMAYIVDEHGTSVAEWHRDGGVLMRTTEADESKSVAEVPLLRR